MDMHNVETIMLTHTSLNIGQIEHFFKTLTLLNLIYNLLYAYEFSNILQFYSTTIPTFEHWTNVPYLKHSFAAELSHCSLNKK